MLVQLPDGDWVDAASVRGVGDEILEAQGFKPFVWVDVKGRPQPVCIQAATQDEAVSMRDRIALDVNSVLGTTAATQLARSTIARLT